MSDLPKIIWDTPRVRWAILKIHTYILIDICQHGASNIKVVGNKLPEDTRFIRAGHNQNGSMFLVLESQEFEEIKEGDKIPELPSVQFEKS